LYTISLVLSSMSAFTDGISCNAAVDAYTHI
jgi:hypothetical protein